MCRTCILCEWLGFVLNQDLLHIELRYISLIFWMKNSEQKAKADLMGSTGWTNKTLKSNNDVVIMSACHPYHVPISNFFSTIINEGVLSINIVPISSPRPRWCTHLMVKSSFSQSGVLYAFLYERVWKKRKKKKTLRYCEYSKWSSTNQNQQINRFNLCPLILLMTL